MRRRYVLCGALLLLASTLAVDAASARTVEGFVEADAPIPLQGDLQTELIDPTVWIRDADPIEPTDPLILHTDRAVVHRLMLDTRTTHAETPVEDFTFEAPQDGVSEESYAVENVTIEITALGPTADVLLGPIPGKTLIASSQGTTTEGQVNVLPDGLRVFDGYREMHGFDQRPVTGMENGSAFDYRYEVNRSLIELARVPTVHLAGSATSYVWDAHVLIRNETSTIARYQTGYQTEESQTGTSQREHYEYLTFELDGLEASVPTGSGEATVLADGVHLGLDGTVQLDHPSGPLRAQEGLYRTSQRPTVDLSGNLSLAMTSSPEAVTPPRVTAEISGTVDETNLELIEAPASFSTTDVVTVSAGGATVLGLAAWYTFSAKGAGLAIPLLGRARHERETDEGTVAPAPDEPGQLLFDPDRFSLYHLIRSRVGLSAEECREISGIQDTDRHLELLVDHGLLQVMAQAPRRYCLPGAVDPEQAERIAFLRRPEARRLSELLAVHGLTPEDRLMERASKTEGPLEPGRVPELVQAFTSVGLAYREPGEDGYVIDPTDALFDTLERMGESAVPNVS